MAPKCNANMSSLIGSYASVAAMLDEVAKEPIKGVMLTFDDFIKGVGDVWNQDTTTYEVSYKYCEKVSSIGC